MSPCFKLDLLPLLSFSGNWFRSGFVLEFFSLSLAKEREKNSNTNPDLNQFPEKESKGSKSNLKQGDITFKTGPIRSVIEPVSPSGGTKAGKIHVTIYVNSNGTVVAAATTVPLELT